MITVYDGITWEIGDIPIGSSTPDDLFELSYRATGECPECGSHLIGTAHVWSRSESMENNWIERISYHPCGCWDDDEEWEDDDYDEEEEYEDEDF